MSLIVFRPPNEKVSPCNGPPTVLASLVSDALFYRTYGYGRTSPIDAITYHDPNKDTEEIDRTIANLVFDNVKSSDIQFLASMMTSLNPTSSTIEGYEHYRSNFVSIDLDISFAKYGYIVHWLSELLRAKKNDDANDLISTLPLAIQDCIPEFQSLIDSPILEETKAAFVMLTQVVVLNLLEYYEWRLKHKFCTEPIFLDKYQHDRDELEENMSYTRKQLAGSSLAMYTLTLPDGFKKRFSNKRTMIYFYSIYIGLSPLMMSFLLGESSCMLNKDQICEFNAKLEVGFGYGYLFDQDVVCCRVKKSNSPSQNTVVWLLPGVKKLFDTKKDLKNNNPLLVVHESLIRNILQNQPELERLLPDITTTKRYYCRAEDRCTLQWLTEFVQDEGIKSRREYWKWLENNPDRKKEYNMPCNPNTSYDEWEDFNTFFGGNERSR